MYRVAHLVVVKHCLLTSIQKFHHLYYSATLIAMSTKGPPQGWEKVPHLGN